MIPSMTNQHFLSELSGLDISSTPKQPIGVATNTPVTFQATLAKGYLPNINFG